MDTPPSRGRGGQGPGRGSRGRGPRPRGHLLPQSQRSHRHRPRARVLPDQDTPELKRRREEAAEGAAKAPQQSSFAQLHATLTTADAVAAYLQDKAHKDVLTDPKTLQTFIGAALSGRPDDVFAALVSDFKHEVFQLLFSLYSLCTTGKLALRPPSQEFLIRCEQHGVRQPEWEAALTAAHGVDTSLLSPKAMLKRLAQVEPVGRLQRLMEMSRTSEDVQKCALKLQKLVDGEGGAGEGEDSGARENNASPHHAAGKKSNKKGAKPRVSGGGGVSFVEDAAYANHCQLLSKLVSKIRRIASSSGSHAVHDTSEEKEEEEEKKMDAPSNDEEEEEKEEQDISSPSSNPREPLEKLHWTEEERAVIAETFTIVTSILDSLLKDKPTSSTLHPVAKLLKFAEWAGPLDLIREKDALHIKALDDSTQESLQQTADQMEIVMRLKALPAEDTAELEKLLNELWNEESQSFFPTSSDVLSSIATAAEQKGIEESVQKETARRLAATQTLLKTSGSSQVLPRRALRFVSAFAQKEKQAEVAKHIQALAQA